MKKQTLIIILFNIFLSLNLYASKVLYLSYESVPKKIYKNQNFEVIVKALITTNEAEYLTTTFTNYSGVTILNEDSKWLKVSENTYENRYYFKVNGNSFKLPTIKVSLLKEDLVVDDSYLKSLDVDYFDFGKKNERFSGIIASELLLKAYKTKQYNNKEALTIIDLDGINSNLEDFKINFIEEQGISSIKSEYPKQNLIYYFVTPVHEKKITITYFNDKTKSFNELVIPLILQNELVSTQTDLNPNDSSFEKYKKIAVVVLFLILLIIYIIKRGKVILFLTIISFVVALIYVMPHEEGVVKKDSFIYILPTKNSTIFFKLQEDLKVKKLQEKNGFIKVIGVEKDFIGWVKEDNFGKN